MPEPERLPSDAAAVSAEIVELEGQMVDPRTWFHDKAGQERYRQLVEAEDSGAAPPAKPSAIAQRIAEIETLMQDRLSDYWRGPRAETLQQEYRQLLDGEEAGGFPAEMVKSWAGSLEVSEEDMLGAFERAGEIAEAVGNTSDLDSAFVGLSDSLQKSCWQALAQPERRAGLKCLRRWWPYEALFPYCTVTI